MNAHKRQQLRQLNESLRITDDLIDEVTTGVFKQHVEVPRRRIDQFAPEQIVPLQLLSKFSPYHKRLSNISSKMGHTSEQILFVKENLAILTAEQQADFNALNMRSKTVMMEYIPSILATGFFGSLVYAIATQSTMKSVAMPVFKGTLLGVLVSIGYYRYDRKQYAKELSAYYSMMVARLARNRRGME